MSDEVTSLADARSDREGTDPRASLVEAQLRAHGQQIAQLSAQVEGMYGILRSIARKLGVET